MHPETPSPLLELIAHATTGDLAGQIAAIAAVGALSWWFDALILKKINAAGKVRTVAVSSIKRIAFPLFMLIGIWVARFAFDQLALPVSLFRLTMPLLLSLLFIRLIVYLLRNLFPNSARLKSWEFGIAGTAWLAVALHLTGLLDPVLAALEAMSFSLGHQHVSLLVVMQGLVSIAATVLAALWIGRFMEVRIMGMEEMDANSRVLLTKVVRGALLVVSVLVALSLVGIDIRILSVFGGALGVGLGFGLQRIASNYICGFIILLDKSIRLGDVITLDNRSGTVSNLTGRYMVLRGQDGAESLIPNETAITQTLVNHSFTDRKSRVKIVLQVSYRSDLDVAMQIMLDAAKNHDRVIADPAPSLNLLEFADNGIVLELSAWVDDPEVTQGALRSEINLVIWREFKRAGIEIPYPQREVRLINPV